MSDKVFVDGLFFNLPRENAPEFVKGNLNIDMKKFIEWAKTHHKDGKVSIDLLMSKAGKPYTALNTFVPKETAPAEPEFQDDIPF